MFVGNGYFNGDKSEIVDSFDIVVRSGRCVGYGKYAGTKTDVWCVRGEEEPWGMEIATTIDIPPNVPKDASLLFLVAPIGEPEPKLGMLRKRFPVLREKTVLRVSDAPTRRKLIELKATTDYPTMGTIFFDFINRMEMYKQHEFWCCGMTWDRCVANAPHDLATEIALMESYSWLNKL